MGPEMPGYSLIVILKYYELPYVDNIYGGVLTSVFICYCGTQWRNVLKE